MKKKSVRKCQRCQQLEPESSLRKTKLLLVCLPFYHYHDHDHDHDIAHLQCHFHSVKRRSDFFGKIVKTPRELYVLLIRCCFDCKLAFSTDHSLNKRIIMTIGLILRIVFLHLEMFIYVKTGIYSSWFSPTFHIFFISFSSLSVILLVIVIGPNEVQFR